MPKYVTSVEEYDEIINMDDDIMVSYGAMWCNSCLAMAPFLEELEKKYPSLKVYKVDVDDLAEIAADNDIESMPTFLLYKNGTKVGEVVGANREKLESLVSKNV